MRRARRTGQAIEILVRWHLWSLDGPTVAMVWMWFVARSVGVKLPGKELAAMFLAVWVVYAGDRLLDGWRFERGAETYGVPERMEARHWVHWRYRRWFGWGIAGASCGVAALLPAFRADELEAYVGMGAALGCWFGVIHVLSKEVPKEWGVGVFFAVAAFVPAWVRVADGRTRLAQEAVLFGALCCVNCLFISNWEGGEGRRLAVRSARWVAMGLAGVAMARFLGGRGAVLLAVGLSAGLLVALDGMKARVERTMLRACADAAMLTPLVVGMWMR